MLNLCSIVVMLKERSNSITNRDRVDSCNNIWSVQNVELSMKLRCVFSFLELRQLQTQGRPSSQTPYIYIRMYIRICQLESNPVLSVSHEVNAKINIICYLKLKYIVIVVVSETKLAKQRKAKSYSAKKIGNGNLIFSSYN